MLTPPWLFFFFSARWPRAQCEKERGAGGPPRRFLRRNGGEIRHAEVSLVLILILSKEKSKNLCGRQVARIVTTGAGLTFEGEDYFGRDPASSLDERPCHHASLRSVSTLKSYRGRDSSIR
jgi:hypothetical protein